MENLEQIQIPASCIDIDDVFMAFDFNEKLKNIDVNSGNEVFSSIGGVLFDAEGKTLMFYPMGKTDTAYIVPDTCETIDNLYSDNLKTVTLGKNTKSITGEVGGSNLEIVNISDSLDDISDHAFESDDLSIGENNANFTYENKVLYDKNKTKLYQVMRTYTDSDFTLPYNLTRICEAAFWGTSSELKVNILFSNIVFNGNPFGFLKTTKGTIYVPSAAVKTDIQNALTSKGITGVNVVINSALNDLINTEFEDGSHLDLATGIRWKFDNGTLDIYGGGDLRNIDEFDFPWCDFGEDRIDYCEEVVNLVLHEGVTGIDNGLISDMEDLLQISLPSTFIYMGDDTEYSEFFLFNDNLKSINVAKGNSIYASVDGVLFNKELSALLYYPEAKENSEYTVPETCKRICYLYSENLEDINLGNNLEAIEEEYGVGGMNVKKLSIPATLKLSDFPMFELSKNATIDIDDQNLYMLIENNIIYNKDKTILNQMLQTYSGTSLVIPDSVSEIGNLAFAYTSTPVTTITIPESVRKIGERAFTSVKNISRVNLLSSEITFNGTPFFISAASTSDYSAFYVPTSTDRAAVLEALARAKVKNVSVYVDDELLGGGIPFTEQEKDTFAGNACGKIEVKISKNSMVYTGDALQPKLTVKYIYRLYDDNGNLPVKSKAMKLSPNVDYSVSYKNNIDCGEGTIVITGMGEYRGVIEKSFTITQKNATKLKIEPIADLVYEGNDLTETIQNEVIVKDGAMTVSKDDYSVIITGNANAPGAVSVSISPTQGGNYYGVCKAVSRFNIIDVEGKTNASELVLTINTKKPCTYNGKAQKPKVTVTAGGNKVASKNYKLVYKNNVNAGTGIVYAVGKNMYYGKSSEYTFNIEKKSFNKVKIARLYQIQLMKTIDDIHPIVKDGSKVLREGYDYIVTFDSVSDMSLLGYKFKKVKVYVTSISSNYIEGTISTELTILPKKLGNNIHTVVYVEDDFYMQGVACEPSVNVYYGGKLLWVNDDYTITYKNNKKPGKGIVIITGVGNYSGKVSKTFKISK